jgi:hypothetical protein
MEALGLVPGVWIRVGTRMPGVAGVSVRVEGGDEQVVGPELARRIFVTPDP